MANVTKWDVEDTDFWENTGKAVARRNLWISIPSLLCGFAVWLYWGIITVQMLNLGFPFTQAELFTLTAIAGLSGATLRIPSTFFIRIAGGRNTIFFHNGSIDDTRCGYRLCLEKSGNADVDVPVAGLCCRVLAVGISRPPCRISASFIQNGCRAHRWGSMPDWVILASPPCRY